MIRYAQAVKQFTNLYQDKVKNLPDGLPIQTELNVKFITQMIRDEMAELVQAKDETERVDALVDIFYYSLDSLLRCDFNFSIYLHTTTKAKVRHVHVEEMYTRINRKLVDLRAVKSESERRYKIIAIATMCFNEVQNCGHDFKQIFNLVQEANMSKFTLPGGYLDEQGKWCKPPEFVAPDDDIRQIVEANCENQRLREIAEAEEEAERIEAEEEAEESERQEEIELAEAPELEIDDEAETTIED